MTCLGPMTLVTTILTTTLKMIGASSAMSHGWKYSMTKMSTSHVRLHASSSSTGKRTSEISAKVIMPLETCAPK